MNESSALPHAAIEARGLVKSFGARAALRGVTLSLAPGEVCSLFGPNGAGKTTLLKIIAGLSRPTEGEARVLGGSPREARVRASIGVLGHGGWLHDSLSAEENLRFYARLYGMPAPSERIETVLAEVGLSDRRRDRVAGFSRGMRQRLAIARAVLHEPTVLLLDEPFTGLDRAGVRRLGEFLRGIAAGGRTVLAVTHEMDVGLDLATRVAVLAAGRLVLDRPAAGLEREGFERIYLDAVEAVSPAATANATRGGGGTGEPPGGARTRGRDSGEPPGGARTRGGSGS